MTIEISTINRCLDLSRYRQTNDTAEDMELRQLQQNALTELLTFDKVAIQNQLARMDQIKQRFEKFWKIYTGKVTEFKNSTMDEQLFIENIKGLFIVPKFPDGHITLDFILDLQSAVMYKDAYLYGFVEQVKLILPTDAPPAMDQELKPVKTFLSHLVMDENKKQQFADQLKIKYSDLTGKDLAIMFYAAKQHIRLKNLKSLLHDWQQYVGYCSKRDEAMNKAMRTLKGNEQYYATELKTTGDEILNIYQSIE
jgi:hypothetical protein